MGFDAVNVRAVMQRGSQECTGTHNGHCLLPKRSSRNGHGQIPALRRNPPAARFAAAAATVIAAFVKSGRLERNTRTIGSVTAVGR